ncbi:MoxR family ATPase [Streptomyces sp. NPDC047046]|uniref:AAA family ATPase n=1 Tax=Streptomyces sp. NPDC047046 TaxID=3155378 RepID=UPI0033F96FC2
MRTVKDWWLYQGPGTSAERRARLLGTPAPPWRAFNGEGAHPPAGAEGPAWERTRARGADYVPDDAETDAVNTALYLRRPLLVTGKPGTGKSSLAHSIATDLGLGPVLHWPITSRSVLREGLYQYDAIGRLQEASLEQLRVTTGAAGRRGGAGRRDRAAGRARPRGGAAPAAARTSLSRFLRLGALGTALLPAEQPRVLLIDEIDKSDIDLPGDLLTVFEDGGFAIPELSRTALDEPTVAVATADHEAEPATITGGQVQCRYFPVVVMTSNGERDFPPAFLRRCVRLRMEPPNEEKLARIVRKRLAVDVTEHPEYARFVKDFVERRAEGDLATDQLLNAIQLRLSEAWPDEADREKFLDTVMRRLTGPTA